MNSPFGLLAFLHWNHDWNNAHFPEPLVKQAAKQIKDLGVDMVRLDVVWSDVHTGFHKYDFSRYDRLMNLLAEHEVKPLVLLHYNKERLDASGKEVWSDPPESFDEYADYVHATVSRYKTTVHHWEIWNEPNHPVYWSKPKDQLKTYVNLLRKAYRAAKSADPSCLVLNGGITEPVVEDVENLYTSGGGLFFDILAIHTFLNPWENDHQQKFEAIVEGVRNVMLKHGDEQKRIWITEMGCPGVPQPKQVKNWWAGDNLSEQQQADWLEKQFEMIKKYPYVEKLFWAFYRDTNGFFNDGTDYFGLVRFDLSPKPAFERYQKLIRAR